MLDSGLHARDFLIGVQGVFRCSVATLTLQVAVGKISLYMRAQYTEDVVTRPTQMPAQYTRPIPGPA